LEPPNIGSVLMPLLDDPLFADSSLCCRHRRGNGEGSGKGISADGVRSLTDGRPADAAPPIDVRLVGQIGMLTVCTVYRASYWIRRPPTAWYGTSIVQRPTDSRQNRTGAQINDVAAWLGPNAADGDFGGENIKPFSASCKVSQSHPPKSVGVFWSFQIAPMTLQTSVRSNLAKAASNPSRLPLGVWGPPSNTTFLGPEVSSL